MNPTAPDNPFAPPKADLTIRGAKAPVIEGALASRWRRLGGFLVDAVVMWIGIGPAYLGISLAAATQPERTIKIPFFIYIAAGSWGYLAALLAALITAIQWTLIVKRGQTLGKMVAGTRIVMLDGARAGFVPALVRRTWSVSVAAILGEVVTALGALLALDMLFVFRSDRRCLHDLIAGTKVVRAGKKP